MISDLHPNKLIVAECIAFNSSKKVYWLSNVNKFDNTMTQLMQIFKKYPKIIAVLRLDAFGPHYRVHLPLICNLDKSSRDNLHMKSDPDRLTIDFPRSWRSTHPLKPLLLMWF